MTPPLAFEAALWFAAMGLLFALMGWLADVALPWLDRRLEEREAMERVVREAREKMAENARSLR